MRGERSAWTKYLKSNAQKLRYSFINTSDSSY